jgi:hypothetical protein
MTSHTTPLLLDPSLPHRPRTSIDVQVGKFHVLQVLIHIRKRDWKWYQDHAQDITEEFQELLQERVLPRMVGNEIEDFLRSKYPNVLPPPEEDKVASKNKKGGNKKREIATAGKGKGKKAAAPNATFKNPKKRKGIVDDDGSEKAEKDVYFSFGDIIQLSYRREPAMSYKTIFFEKKNPHAKAKEGSKTSAATKTPFRDYRRLSHRLLIWISKLDPDQKTNPDLQGIGFYRPEMIPISSLFRQPADLDLDDDDNDD